MSLDIRSVLPSIACPVLILHRKSNRHYRLQYGQYLHQHIEHSQLIVLEGADCHPFFAGEIDSILIEAKKFLSVDDEARPATRELATIMFTDIVDSTKLVALLGDENWLEKLDKHNVMVRNSLRQHRGKELETTGDGFLVTFDGPARAIHCAKKIQEQMQGIGLKLRIGLHTGELEYKQGIPRGIALHLTSRIMSVAEQNEICVSRTVRDLVIGSEIAFKDKGAYPLKGIPDQWQLFSVV
jgi:class 3 adenylate cyclase